MLVCTLVAAVRALQLVHYVVPWIATLQILNMDVCQGCIK